MASEPMILSCSHCGGMMKVDEAKIPSNRRFKVRCPHCENIDVVTYQSSGHPESQAARHEKSATEQPTPAERKPRTYHNTEPSTVTRSSGDIRFPADTGDEEKRARIFIGRKTRIILWAVGSLLWIGFCALVVNLVLPGPYGGSPVTGLPSQEDTAPQIENPLHQPRGKSMQKSPANR